MPVDTRPAWLAALREQNPSLAADLSAVLLEHRTLIEQFLGRGESTTAGGVATATQTRWVPGAPMGLARSANFEDDFAGTDRFAVIRRLGAGGMGVVYEVHDQARHEVVALKTLRRTTPAGIYRLKQEFRSLAGCLASKRRLPLRAVCRRRPMLLHDGARAGRHLRRLRQARIGSRRCRSLGLLLPCGN